MCRSERGLSMNLAQTSPPLTPPRRGTGQPCCSPPGRGWGVGSWSHFWQSKIFPSRFGSLCGIKEKSRRLIDFHYDLEITSVEIARKMEMNADAVRRALFRLREQLRKCVGRLLRTRPA